MKRILTFIKSIFIVLIVGFLAHSIYITIDGLTDKQTGADVAIVLGNKVNEDGTLSERLKARLDKCIELFNQNRVKSVIVSGGFGKEGFWEGKKMQEYLVENRIPPEKILVDNYGNDTEKTVENSIRIMDSLNFKSAISVSQFFHQTRTKKLFRIKGFDNIESASPDYFEWRDFYSIFREFVAYYKKAI